MKKEKTFILGVGAQKAGTTWLYKYIQNDPKANFGLLKEYHFWNLLFASTKGNPSTKKKNLLSKPRRKLSSGELLRWSMIVMQNYYHTYFNSIINDGYQITGDITPQYGRSSIEQFSHIKTTLEKYNFTVKVIYLIRDPLERLWSNIRMEKNLYSSIKSKLSDTEAIKLYFKDRHWEYDSKYDEVIVKLRDAFKKENIYIGVYEEMFNKNKVKELSDFIGIDYNPSMIEKKINTSKKTEELDAKVIEEVREFYSETYNFCYQNFPQTKHLWNK